MPFSTLPPTHLQKNFIKIFKSFMVANKWCLFVFFVLFLFFIWTGGRRRLMILYDFKEKKKIKMFKKEHTIKTVISHAHVVRS